jgi:sensor histidine kinase regulating citrate/malate metabolism
MSKIYDALIQAGKKSEPGTAVFRSGSADKAGSLWLWWQSVSLEWKITGMVGAVILVFGIFLMILANQLMGRALRSEIDHRALAIATNLSDGAAGHVLGKNVLELYALLTKYARLEGAAYAFIEDSNGRIVAHTLRPFPPELMETLTPDQRKQAHRRVVTVEGKTVYETRVPILEGQLGAAHLGMWGDEVNAALRGARLPFLGLIALALSLAVIISVLVVRAAIAPIRGLTDMATQVSDEELATPVKNRIAG